MARIPTAQEAGFGGLGIQPTRPVPVRPFFGSAVGATPEAFGAGVGQGLTNLAAAGQQAGNTILDIATDIQREKTVRAAKDADLEYSKQLRELMYGDGTPNNPGYYGLEGKAAVEGQAAAIQAMEEARQRIEESLGQNQRARQIFGDTAAARLDQEMKRVSTHSFQQGKVANRISSEARRNEEIDNAVARYNDPKAVQRSLVVGAEEVFDYEINLHGDEEVANSQVGEYTTQFHTAIIDRYLADGDYLAAQAYFDKNIDQIDGRNHPGILDAIARETTQKAGSVKREARDRIAAMAKGVIPAGDDAFEAELNSIPVGAGGEGLETLREDYYAHKGDVPVVAEYATKPLAEVEGFLATFRARQSSTDPDQQLSLEEIRRGLKIEKLHAEQVREFQDGNGLVVAASNGVIDELQPIDYTDPESLQRRNEQAEVASQVYGVDVPPLTEVDIEQLGNMITGTETVEAVPLQDVSTILGNLYEVMGEDAALFAVRDLIEKRYKEVGVAASVAADRPEVATEIVAGGRFLKENPEYKISAENMRIRNSEEYGNTFTDFTAASLGDINAAVNGIYALRAFRAGVTDYDAEIHAQAIQDVTGGILSHNGRNIISPVPGMSQGEFDAAMRHVDNDMLLDENGELPKLGDGTEFTADKLVASIWRDEANLVSTSMQGTYNIEIPGLGFVMNGDGSEAFELDLRSALATLAGPEPTATIPQSFLTEAGEAVLPPVVDAERSLAQAQRAARVGSEIQGIPAPMGDRPFPSDRPEIAMSVSRRFTAVAEFNAADGIPTTMYKDSLGVPTIGIGFNLQKEGARELIQGLGYDYDAVLAGKQEITVEDANTLFQQDYAEAEADAREVVPGFEVLDRARQLVFTDMLFNLGRSNFLEFRGMLSAIAAQDWDLAAAEAKDSLWYKQVGRRGRRNVEIIRTGRLVGFD